MKEELECWTLLVLDTVLLLLIGIGNKIALVLLDATAHMTRTSSGVVMRRR